MKVMRNELISWEYNALRKFDRRNCTGISIKKDESGRQIPIIFINLDMAPFSFDEIAGFDIWVKALFRPAPTVFEKASCYNAGFLVAGGLICFSQLINDQIGEDAGKLSVASAGSGEFIYTDKSASRTLKGYSQILERMGLLTKEASDFYKNEILSKSLVKHFRVW